MNISNFISSFAFLNFETWVSPNSYDCLNQVIYAHLPDKTIALVTDLKLNSWLSTLKNITLYAFTDDIPKRTLHFSTVMIFSSLCEWIGPNLQGNIVLLTQALQCTEILWKKFKIIDLIVLLQKSSVIEIYSWFPYDENNCREEPKLVLINVWQNGGFAFKSILLPNKIPNDFHGCSLVIGWTDCPPFLQNAESGHGFSGPEVQVVEDLARFYNFTLKLYPEISREGFYALVQPNGSYGGAIALMLNRQVDLAGAALSSLHMGVDQVDKLPSHLTEYLSWIAPPPLQLTQAHGLYSGLSGDVWTATFFSTVMSALLALVGESPSKGIALLWSLSRLLGVSYTVFERHSILKTYSILFEMGTLVISTLYKASVLINLTLKPMSFYESPEQALDSGLFLFYRPNHKQILSESGSKIWQKIQSSGKYTSSFYCDYEKIIENRSHFALAFKYIDKERILKKYPNRSYSSLVQEFRDHFHRMDQSIMLPPSHPLTNILTEKMRVIIESGLPSLYLRHYFFKYNEEIENSDSEEKDPLEMNHILPACYLLMLLLVLCSLVFFYELYHQKFVCPFSSLGK